MGGAHYSEDEQVIGTWIDNKPLYQKTCNFNTATGAAWSQINHNVSNLDQVVNAVAVVKRTDNDFYLNGGINGGGIFICINASTVQIWTMSGTVWDNVPCWITFQYTKTTD